VRLVFAGTPDVAVPSLDALCGSSHDVVAVLTRPDAPAGRGRSLVASPIKERARELGLEILTPGRPGDQQFQDRLRELAPDACPIVAYGGLIPLSLLAIPTHGWINLHFSLLPAWRGAAPVQHAIMAGDEVTGATTFLLDEGLDTGPTFGVMTETIKATDTSGDLLARLAQGGAGLLVATIDALESGELHASHSPLKACRWRRRSASRMPESVGATRHWLWIVMFVPVLLRPVHGRCSVVSGSRSIP
jgi:methionyl-tRNA formyltransferase